MEKYFIHIVNPMRTLRKVFQNEDLVLKLLRCLNRSWQPKATIIYESKELSCINLVALFE